MKYTASVANVIVTLMGIIAMIGMVLCLIYIIVDYFQVIEYLTTYWLIYTGKGVPRIGDLLQ